MTTLRLNQWPSWFSNRGRFESVTFGQRVFASGLPLIDVGYG